MTIRIGANPIGWSNDDLRELGGETPLETCLAEAKEAGFEGMELGNKFPREPKALKAALAPLRPRPASPAGIRPSCSPASPRTSSRRCGRISTCSRRWARKVLVFAETSNAIHGDRAKPLVAAAGARRPANGPEFGRRVTAVADAVLAEEAARWSTTTTWARWSQSEADIDAFMAATGAVGASPARHRPRDLGRRRPGGARPPLSRPHQPCPRQGRAQGRDGARRRPSAWSFLDAVIEGVYTVPGDGMRRLSRPCFARTAGLFAAGSWSRPSRIRKRPIPLTYAKMGYANLHALPRSEAGLRSVKRRDVEASRQTAPPDARPHPRDHAGQRRLDLCRLRGLPARRPADRRAATGDREACLVLVSGKARVAAGGERFRRDRRARRRRSSGKPWSVYVPARLRPGRAAADDRLRARRLHRARARAGRRRA